MVENRIKARRMKFLIEEHDENLNKIIYINIKLKNLEALTNCHKANQIESPSGEMTMKQQKQVVQSLETILQEPTNTISTTSKNSGTKNMLQYTRESMD